LTESTKVKGLERLRSMNAEVGKGRITRIADAIRIIKKIEVTESLETRRPHDFGMEAISLQHNHWWPEQDSSLRSGSMQTTSTAPSKGGASGVSFFADVFRDSGVPSVILAPKGLVLFWNRAAERLFGWSPEEVLGRPLTSVLVPPERIDEHHQIRRRTLDGQGFSQHRITRRAKDGRLIEVSLSTWPIRGSDGRVTGIIGIYADRGAEELRFRQSLAKKQLEEVARLYATAPIGLGFLDTDLRFVRVNERLAQIDGLAAEAHAGRRFADVAPEAAASLEGIYREVIATGVPLVEHELRASTPALPGVQRDWQVSAYPLTGPGGTPLGLTFAVSDITERKRLNEQLKRQEMLLRLVLDNLPGEVLYIDRDYRYRFANRAFGEWFHRPPLGPEGLEINEVVGEAMFERGREHVNRALAGEQVEFEEHAIYPSGERDVYVNCVPDRGPDGVVRGTVVLVQDVTERKTAERALRNSEERFRRMVEIAAEGIWIVDTTGKTSFVNKRMAAILGYSKEEMLGVPCCDYLDSEECNRARGLFKDCIHSQPGPQEYRFRHKDGSVVWLDVTLAPMLDGAGACTGILAMCTDVTERKKNEQRLRQAQKLESLGILAAGVAHDFNNLLTGIMGNASLVLEGVEPGSGSSVMLKDVIAASEKAAQLTRQLLTYAGKDQGKLRPLDVAAATRELAPLLRASIPKMVQLSLELEDNVPMVEADPGQLQQVMMNLVINAGESIPERTPGEVRVVVGRHNLQPEDYGDAVIPIETGNAEYVSFTVVDNGSGMDAATQARIFDPFFSTKFSGRGLGLAAVLGIVKGHHGTLTLRTVQGSGSAFTVFLPASQAARQVDVPRRSMPKRAATGGGAILVVDDEPALRKLAQEVLEQRGYHVLLAENGQQAITMLAAHPEVHAVVLDLAMPVMGGDIAGPMIRSLRPDVPLILSSGYSESDALERVGQDLATAFLEKPYRWDMLVTKIEEALRSRPSK
jgi:PAS domain S-box-containing protein